MFLWIPLAAASAYAFNFVAQKRFLARSKIPLGEYLARLTLLNTILAWLSAPLWWRVDVSAGTEVQTLLLLAILVGCAATSTLLYQRSLRREQLTRFDSTIALEPLMIMAVAAVIIPAERDPRIWLATVVGLGALAYAHKGRRLFAFDVNDRSMLLAILAVAFSVTIYKLLLESFSPFVLHAIITTCVALIFGIRYGFGWYKTAGSLTWQLLGLSVLGTAVNLLYGASYHFFGVTLTTLVELVYPVILFVLARSVFHEIQPPRAIVGGLVIIGTVAYSLFFLAP